MEHHFSSTQLSLLIGGAVSLFISLFFQWKEKEKLSSLLLVVSALFIFCFAASLDPFLNLYDERFHALVAKHLSLHPFEPTLYDDPVVLMDYDYWDKYHIWLHKQPLFLWQMALSYKIFGPSEFAIRLPSVIMGVLLVTITLRSGKLLVNFTTGYVSAILVITSFYFFELVAGRQMVDHNDVAFIGYVSLSIWALIEYEYSGKKRKWIFLIGLFSGLAILNKWLPGLVVYAGWAVLKLRDKSHSIRRFKDILVSLFIAVIVALPWQVYILLKFPAEALFSYQLNSRHFFEVVEGHSGDIWFYLDSMGKVFGKLSSFFIIPAFITLYKQMKDKYLYYSLTGMVLLVFIFFSIAKTKMPSFTLMVSMILFISFGALVTYLVQYISSHIRKTWVIKLIFPAIIILLVSTRFDYRTIKEKHTLWKKENLYSRALIHNKQVFSSLELPQNAVLFNVKGQHYVDAMYYTGLPAYHDIPTHEQYIDLKEKGRIIAIFKASELPDYLADDPTVIIIDKKLDGYN